MTPTKRALFAIYICVLAFMPGCGGTLPYNAQKVFSYDYTVKGKSQADLWQNALFYFTEDYVDDSLDLSVMDATEGIIIGRGSAPWKIGVFDPNCLIDYNVRFAAKDERALLQFELIEGVPAESPCKVWPWPSADGYSQVLSYFDGIARKLVAALKGDAAGTK